MLTVVLNRRRKTLIGYLAYVVGKRVARSVLRRQVNRFLEAKPPPRRRRRLPLIGAGLAIAAGAVALFLRSRGTDE